MTDLNLLMLFDALVAPQDLSLGSGNGKGVTLSPLLSEIFAMPSFSTSSIRTMECMGIKER